MRCISLSSRRRRGVGLLTCSGVDEALSGLFAQNCVLKLEDWFVISEYLRVPSWTSARWQSNLLTNTFNISLNLVLSVICSIFSSFWASSSAVRNSLCPQTLWTSPLKVISVHPEHLKSLMRRLGEGFCKKKLKFNILRYFLRIYSSEVITRKQQSYSYWRNTKTHLTIIALHYTIIYSAGKIRKAS